MELSLSSERGLSLKGNLSGSVRVSDQVQLLNLIFPEGQQHFNTDFPSSSSLVLSAGSMAKVSESSLEERFDPRKGQSPAFVRM